MSELGTLTGKSAQVRHPNQLVKDYIERLRQIWVKGEIAQINSKPSWKLSCTTLRDTSAEFSVSIACSTAVLHNNPLCNGGRVVVLDKPAFYAGRGQFSLWAMEWRPVGLGQLLARSGQLRQVLTAEGFSDPQLKCPLPYLPSRIGLITSHGSAVERDMPPVTDAH